MMPAFGKNFIKTSVLAASSFLLLACQLAATTEPRPAVLVSSNETVMTASQIEQDTLNEIKSIIRQSLNGAKITLAKQFLVDSSWLIIEPRHKKTLNNLQPLGRSYDKPIKFQLLKSAKQCFIRQNGTAKLWPLKKARCQLEK